MYRPPKEQKFPWSTSCVWLQLSSPSSGGGKTYKKNGHTIHLGTYTLDEITEDGTATTRAMEEQHIQRDERRRDTQPTRR